MCMLIIFWKKSTFFIVSLIGRYVILLADKNIMCQDILINVIDGSESERWKLRFGVNQERHRFLPVLPARAMAVQVKRGHQTCYFQQLQLFHK